jgi:hypothetical protein
MHACRRRARTSRPAEATRTAIATPICMGGSAPVQTLRTHQQARGGHTHRHSNTKDLHGRLGPHACMQTPRTLQQARARLTMGNPCISPLRMVGASGWRPAPRGKPIELLGRQEALQTGRSWHRDSHPSRSAARPPRAAAGGSAPTPPPRTQRNDDRCGRHSSFAPCRKGREGWRGGGEEGRRGGVSARRRRTRMAKLQLDRDLVGLRPRPRGARQSCARRPGLQPSRTAGTRASPEIDDVLQGCVWGSPACIPADAAGPIETARRLESHHDRTGSSSSSSSSSIVVVV